MSLSEEVAAILRKDIQRNPFVYVGVLTYPLNGRSVITDDHIVFSRVEAIELLRPEIEEAEPEYASDGLLLLKSYDRVRIGRLIVDILMYQRDMKQLGAEPS